MRMLDASSMLAFVESQRTHIETEVNATIFPDILYQTLVPVDNTAPPWVKTITARSSEGFGQAAFINGNADDIPTAGNTYGQNQIKVKMAGIGYEFGFEEVQTAAAYGMNLPSDDAIEARHASERFIDEIAIRGNAEHGLQGLINTAGVPIEAATAKWELSSTNEDDILKDINKILGGTAVSTGNALPADTLLLPFTTYTYLAGQPLANKSGGTLLSFIMQYNSYTAMTGQPLVIRAMNQLNNAAVGGAADRAVAYSRNPRILKLHVPMLHQFLPTHQVGAMNFVVPGIMRLSGLEIKNKEAFRYIDGV